MGRGRKPLVDVHNGSVVPPCRLGWWVGKKSTLDVGLPSIEMRVMGGRSQLDATLGPTTG